MMQGEWSGSEVLVTGAGGFIGSHLVERLVAQGAHVRAFTRYNSRGDPGLLKLAFESPPANLEIIAGDLRDEAAIRRAVTGCDAVFHLAALISIPYSYRHPHEVVETNVMGTLNVLTACRDLGVRRLIHTSSSEVYGTARYVPIDEAHPLQGQSPYSASKIAADKLAESYYSAYGLPVVTVRPFNTYGPRQSARAVIPTIITQALAQETIRLGNLGTTRDFTYVGDTAEGFLRLAAASGLEGQVINLGSGYEISIGGLAEKILELVNSKARIVVATERMRPEGSEVFRLLADNRTAFEKTGWHPRVALDEGLQATIDWLADHLEYYSIGSYMF